MASNMMKVWPKLRKDEQNRVKFYAIEEDVAKLLLMKRSEVASYIGASDPRLAFKIWPWTLVKFLLRSLMKISILYFLTLGVIGFYVLCVVGIIFLGKMNPWWYTLAIPFIPVVLASIHACIKFEDR